MLLPEMTASIVNGMIAIPFGYIREATIKTSLVHKYSHWFKASR